MRNEHDNQKSHPEQVIASWLRSLDEEDLADAVLDGVHRQFWAELQTEDGAELARDLVDLLGANGAQ